MLLSSVIDRFRDVSILCIGDIMLDNYIFGKVQRISPEAPVPVFEYGLKKSMLGGSGNVVNNLYAVGCKVRALCITGEDDAGRKICSLLDEVAPNSVVMKAPGYMTVEKTRIVAEHNHVLRIDHENACLEDPGLTRSLEEKLPPLIAGADVVLLSDYAKGLLSNERCEFIIKTCLELGRKVIVDPKGMDYRKYRGATLIKPNLKEFAMASGVPCSPGDPNLEASLLNGARHIFSLGIEHLIVTLSQHGMAYMAAENPDEIFRLPTAARDVYDVSGAGDTTLAILGASMAAGANIFDSMKLANIAAGIAVGKVGTSTVSQSEILETLNAPFSGCNYNWKQKVKIITAKQAAQIARENQRQNRKVVFTNGCFDLLHQGHLRSLMAAKAQGDILMVGLNTDLSIKRRKGSCRPAQDEKSRSLLLASLEFVDYIIMFSEDTALPLVEAIRPDVIAKEGYEINDWPEALHVRSYGGRVVTLPRIEGYSTSDIIRRIINSGNAQNS